MCLVAQFGKWLFRNFFFGANVFDVSIQQKSHCRVAHVVKELAFLHADILSQGLLFIFKELQ